MSKSYVEEDGVFKEIITINIGNTETITKRRLGSPAQLVVNVDAEIVTLDSQIADIEARRAIILAHKEAAIAKIAEDANK